LAWRRISSCFTDIVQDQGISALKSLPYSPPYFAPVAASKAATSVPKTNRPTRCLPLSHLMAISASAIAHEPGHGLHREPSRPSRLPSDAGRNTLWHFAARRSLHTRRHPRDRLSFGPRCRRYPRLWIL
jgi:hypothetical protein